MKITKLTRTLTGLALLAISAGCLSADPILTLVPPDLSGPAGTEVGWSATILNNTTDYIRFSDNQFCVPPYTLSPLSCSTPLTTGQYFDIVVGLDPVIAPGDTLILTYDPVNHTDGLAYFLIDPAANVGDTDAGQIVLVYDGFDNNPKLGPANQTVFSGTFFADASVTVDVGPGVPEPGTFGLLGGGCILLGAAVRRKRRDTASR